MSNQELEITDLVTPAQDERAHDLRKILGMYGLEDELPDYDPGEHETPLELKDNVKIWEKKEDLPEKLPEAHYVVIDVVYFSTTAIEALSNGLNLMHLRDSHDAVKEIDAENVSLGGESDGYEPQEGFDFFNSPSNVRDVSLEKEAAMTSYNGAVAALKAWERSPDESEVYIASTTNAEAVAEKIDGSKPVHIVCSGSRGACVAEDHIGAYLVARYLEDRPLDDSELQVVDELLDVIQDHIYEEIPDIRQIDIQEHVKAVNSENVVPRLVKTELGYGLKAEEV